MDTPRKEIKMPSEQLDLLNGLLNRVQSMTDNEFTAILGSSPGFHDYSLFNKMLVAIAGGSQVAGFGKWKDLKNSVKKKSEHEIGAIGILAPSMVYKIKVGGEFKNTSQAKYKKFAGQKKSFPVGFFKVTVFDVTDTVKGKAGLEDMDIMTPKQDTVYNLNLLVNSAEGMGYVVEHRAMEFIKGGCIRDKNIFLNSNKSEAANMGTLIHEIAHGELGHADTTKDHSRELKEQQAETVTFLVCKELGIARNSEFYLKSWGLSKNIMADFAEIQKASKKIINNLRNNTLAFMMDD